MRDPPPGACLDIFEDPRAAGKVLCVHLVDGGTSGVQSLQILAISLDDGTEQVVVEQYAARPEQNPRPALCGAHSQCHRSIPGHSIAAAIEL